MKTVVGLYQRFEDAQRAVEALGQEGFDSKQISMVAGDSEGRYSRYLEGDEGQKQDLGEGTAAGAGIGAVLGGLGGLLVGLGALAIPGIGPVIAAGPIMSALAGAGVGALAGGVVGALVDMGVPEEHAKSYAEGIKQGGTLVTVQTDEMNARHAQDILNRFNPIDITQRQSTWQQGMGDVETSRSQTSYSRSAIPVTGDEDMETELDRESSLEHDIPVTGDRDVSIPIVEEDIRVGKRKVERGGVEIESHMEETPVEEDITLRNERVNVERRPVDRPATEEDFDTFKEGKIEMSETHEEPVVEKRARVVEEVRVNKDVEEETTTIRDSVRHTEVDVNKTGKTGGDWTRFDNTFRQDFQTRYGSGRNKYEYYQPAYRYGFELANDPRYRDYDWNRLESEARTEWTRRGGQTPWEDVKDAIRHAWQSVRR